MEFDIPYPPTINNYYGYKGSRRFISAKGKAFRDEVLWTVKPKETFDVPVEMTLYVYPPDRRKRDSSNLLKAIYDALTHAGVYEDDSLIHDEYLRKMHVVPQGKVHVKVRPFDSESSPLR